MHELGELVNCKIDIRFGEGEILKFANNGVILYHICGGRLIVKMKWTGSTERTKNTFAFMHVIFVKDSKDIFHLGVEETSGTQMNLYPKKVMQGPKVLERERDG